jgi:hypothetical protein
MENEKKLQYLTENKTLKNPVLASISLIFLQ